MKIELGSFSRAVSEKARGHTFESILSVCDSGPDLGGVGLITTEYEVVSFSTMRR